MHFLVPTSTLDNCDAHLGLRSDYLILDNKPPQQIGAYTPHQSMCSHGFPRREQHCHLGRPQWTYRRNVPDGACSWLAGWCLLRIRLKLDPELGSPVSDVGFLTARWLGSRASVLRDKKWKSPIFWSLGPETGTVSLVPDSIGPSSQSPPTLEETRYKPHLAKGGSILATFSYFRLLRNWKGIFTSNQSIHIHIHISSH